MHTAAQLHSCTATATGSSAQQQSAFYPFDAALFVACPLRVTDCRRSSPFFFAFLPPRSAYPDLDCVSIGPTIHHAHSPDECLMIDTVQPFYEWLKQSIVNISKDSIKQ